MWINNKVSPIADRDYSLVKALNSFLKHLVANKNIIRKTKVEKGSTP